MLESKQDFRSVLLGVIVVQEYLALPHESASGKIGIWDLMLRRKGLVAFLPSLKNIIESIEEQGREPRDARKSHLSD